MKILFFSDLHIGLKLGGYDFHDDHKDVLRKLERESWNNYDLMVIGGDVFHKSKPSPIDYQLFIEFLGSIGIPVLIIQGNHDEDDKGRFNALDPISAFYKKQHDSETDIFDLDEDVKVCIVDRPGIIEFEDKKFLCLGHISNARANRQFETDAQTVISELIKVGIRERVDVAFSHLNITGAKIGESYFMKGGELAFTDIDKCSFPILSGHIHKYQRMKSNVYIAGSVIPTNVGETDDKKFLVLEI